MANLTIIKRMISQVHKAIQEGEDTRAAQELAYSYEVKATKKQPKLHQMFTFQSKAQVKRWYPSESIHLVNEQGSLIAPVLQVERVYKLSLVYHRSKDKLAIRNGNRRFSDKTISKLIKNEGFISKRKFIDHHFPPDSSNYLNAQLVCWEEVYY